MSARVIQLIRHAPLDLLQEYFSFLPSAAKLDWNSSNKQILLPLLQIIDELGALDKKRVANDVAKILTMTDELGQAALESIVNNRKTFYVMKNIYQRSLWVFLYDYENFEKAKDIRNADFYLKDSTWDGFIGLKHINILENSDQLPAFEEKIKKLFDVNESVKIEIFNRYLTSDYWDDSRSFQIIIHYEGSSVIYKKFMENDIIHETINPLEELVITYEPNDGQINIISKGKQCKEAIAKIFVETLLNSSGSQEQISLMRYNISKLLKPCDFITLPEDGIESVKILYLLLQKPDSIATFAIEVPINQQESIYTTAEKMFKTYNPLQTDCKLIRVTLSFRFQPNKITRTTKFLSATIVLPNTCNLESNSLEDRPLINKYLKMWDLIEEL